MRVKSEGCAPSIRYGDMPPGFTGAKATAALVAGQRYRVALRGSGFNAETVFERR